jgi:alpha-amylase/alpha-mannosidase (GH57 family)
MERYICIHGHFYQPPRENPWLEDIELQDSAHPFHNWNERITSECYAANGASRMLDHEHHISQIVNNYARISYNFGPTLLSWMQENNPEAYQAIIDADKASRAHFSGHGSALAQVYNHMIMPLANARDKETQTIWGIRDFEHRFGRKPEGIWLAETAANTETLEMLTAHGIKFTVLSPYQAWRVRPRGDSNWHYVDGGRIDPTRVYEQRLPSGRKIALFFYDGPISQGVAFEGLLRQGENLANRLLGAFSGERNWPQLVHIATDGETYGHHHRFGDMALAYALKYIQHNDRVRLTNYGEYLEMHPPTYEAQIIENTSWSCYHGVERWRSNCGCNSGGRPGWNQEWRAPLRRALDWLRDELAPLYEEQAGALLRDPWEARNDYISVILDRTPDNVLAFLRKHARHELSQAQESQVLKLLEMQRHAMLMYTSCGWFFDDLGGIETVQIIQYAGRAIQLAEELSQRNIEAPFLDLLRHARSNEHKIGDGAHIYAQSVKPAMVTLESVGAHYAVSSLFEEYDNGEINIYRYRIHLEDRQLFTEGRTRLLIGRAWITSEITWESALVSFAVLHPGDHNLACAVRLFVSHEAYHSLLHEATAALHAQDTEGVRGILERHFGGVTYSLQSLFRDKQRSIFNQILDASLQESEAAYRQIYNNNASLFAYLAQLGIPLPRSFQTALEFILNADLRRAIASNGFDLESIHTIQNEAARFNVEFAREELSFVLEETMLKLFKSLRDDPHNLALLEYLGAIAELTHSQPFNVDMWEVQNIFYKLLQDMYPAFQRRAHEGDDHARQWVQRVAALGKHLEVRIPHH